MLGLGILIGDLLQHPWLGLLARAGLEAEHHPFALHSLTLEREMEVALFDRLARVLAGLGDPAPAIPQHHRAAAIFALWDSAFKGAVIQRVILGAHGEALVVRVEAGALGNRPAFQDPVHLQAEVPVQARSVVLLDDEAVASALELAALWLRRLREVALRVIGFDVELAGHLMPSLRARIQFLGTEPSPSSQ